ncbi:NADPH-dependent FMN reductase [Streptomyces marispadix]|uniref:NAD(P)H-dependent oxidoreductase n=1 Tax=Streptomyces marispadix TaxID=2922868 RepID=A0ABS9SUI8_9ACTN|nr:NADPH-dependent FMN reductase [Streptomyces marispadix]MCH6159939.1 NAD(P)H-dependent oxidoreductase [Streptomyces marispadix]
MFDVLAISGSLRRDSFNTRLLGVLPSLAPAGMRLRLFEGLGALPMFNEDDEFPAAPPPVRSMCDAIRAADGVVIATPEYNHSVPAVLKNAVDWASRPHGAGALTGKPVAVMSATTGPRGGYRGLSETMRILTELGNLVVPEPEVVVQSARSNLVVGPDGGPQLLDGTAATLLRIQLEALADLIASGAAEVALRAAHRHRAAVLSALDIPHDGGPTAGSIEQRGATAAR